MKKQIVVTQKMIDRAEKMRGNFLRTESCPIALAINSAFRTNKGFVDYQTAGIDRKANPVRFNLPPSARIAMARFDDDKPVKPFKFTVEVTA